MKTSRSRNRDGFTFLELMLATAIFGVVAGATFSGLYTGTTLLAKNIAINLAHQQARTAVVQIQQDLHSAISIPQLTDASRVPVATGPSAGMSFQLFSQGPWRINANAAAGQRVVKVVANSASTPPVAGQRLIIDSYKVNSDIVNTVNEGSNIYSITLASDLMLPIVVTSGAATYNIVCFTTDRVSYVVANRELRYYPKGNATNYAVMSTNITTPLPFTIPTTPAGAPHNRFVAAINLSTADEHAIGRRYKSANMFLHSLVPYRARMADRS